MHVAPTTELKALLRLAGPLIASQLAHMLMVLTDTLMMARISPQALAGGGLGAASYSFVSIFCIGKALHSTNRCAYRSQWLGRHCGLNLVFDFISKFVTAASKELNSVVRCWIVRCRNHHAKVGV